jgi:hypothetical protein
MWKNKVDMACPFLMEVVFIVDLTSQHWMNQGIPCRYGSILQEKKISNLFGNFYYIFVVAQTTRKKMLKAS